MSNLIPSTFSTRNGSPEGGAQPTVPRPDCQFCRISGTATFTAVGVYALFQIRASKTPVGKGAALLAGCGFLTVAVARWTQGESFGLDALKRADA